MFLMFNFVLMISLLGITTSSRYNIVPKFYAQDSAIIIDTDQPPPPSTRQLPNMKPQTATLPYYQPIQTIPAYKIFSKSHAQNSSSSLKSGQHIPATDAAAIFTQEEFPRDLLEIAQQKLGLKTLEEVPSVTELAELLGTNSAAETISYIRQLTSTEQGIALMKAYIESSDYTDSVGSKDNEIANGNESATEEDSSVAVRTTTAPSTQLNELISSSTENVTKPGFFERIASYLNIYNIQPQHKQILQQELVRKKPQTTKIPYRNMRPMYVRSPLPYHYPIQLRPVLMNRTNYNQMRMYNRRTVAAPTVSSKSATAPHINSLKTLSPAHIQHLARIANIPPKTLESFLQRKPKLAELAAKVASFPLTQESGTDVQLLAAVHKAIENDEDLRKLLNSTDTLK